jgi:hypothetical protein
MKRFDFSNKLTRFAALILAAMLALCAAACDGGKGPAKPTDVPEPTQAPATEEPTPDINSLD